MNKREHKIRQIVNPIYTERDYYRINNPRKIIFVSDILGYIGMVIIGFALLWLAIYAVCGGVMVMDMILGGVVG